MSAGSILLASGFSVLTNALGEPLTFRGVTITGSVDRFGLQGRRKSPDFSKKDMSVVMILEDAITPAPRVGETFTDENGVNHRIQTVRYTQPTIVCECKTQA